MHTGPERPGPPTRHHTEHTNRTSPHTRAGREGPCSWYKVNLKWLVVLKCTEQTLRVPRLTGLGGVSRLEPGPASLSAAPQPPPCLKCCSWGRVPTPMPTATPIIYQGLPRLGPLPGLTWGGQGSSVVDWWPPLGREPWGGGQSPCRDGVWHLLTSFSSAHSPYHRGHRGHGRSVHPVVPGRLLHVSSCCRPRSGLGPERLLPLEGRRGSEQGGDRAWGPGPWQGREVSAAPEG